MKSAVERWRAAFWLSAALAVLLAASLAPYLTSSTELVRLRNALLYEPAAAETAWTPEAPPSDFRTERVAPSRLFADTVVAQQLVVEGQDWQTALNIGQHLLQGVVRHRGNGGPIQAGLAETYGRITGAGEGYCGDYVDVFTGLASTAGLFARAWAFSFDGFGGHGHIFNEIWDRQAGTWRMIDVFNNAYVVDAAGEPVSAMAFRQMLRSGAPIAWRRVEPAARPGFIHTEKADDYYRRGAAQWYLWWGNNVFEYDAHPVVNALDGVSRPLAQLAAIGAGVHPEVRVLHDEANAAARERLQWVGLHVRLVAAGLPVAMLLALVSWLAWRRAARRRFE